MPAQLDADVVYITPTGRRCRWVPPDAARRAFSTHSFFEYLNENSAVRDGFNLTPQNYRLLRKEAAR